MNGFNFLIKSYYFHCVMIIHVPPACLESDLNKSKILKPDFLHTVLYSITYLNVHATCLTRTIKK